MFFYKGTTYAKVWKVDTKEKYMELKISTSETDKDGTTKYSNWWPRVIGHAFNSLKEDNVKEGDRIVITTAKFENTQYKDAGGNLKQGAPRLIIIDAKVVKDGQAPNQGSPANTAAKPVNDSRAEADACPW